MLAAFRPPFLTNLGALVARAKEEHNINTSLLEGYETENVFDKLSIIENLDFEAKLSLMNEEIELSGNLHSRFFNAITTAWLVFEHGGIQKARKYLSSIDSIAIQPWHSEKPYVDIVLSAMEHLGDISGLEKYQNQYFKK